MDEELVLIKATMANGLAECYIELRKSEVTAECLAKQEAYRADKSLRIIRWGERW